MTSSKLRKLVVTLTLLAHCSVWPLQYCEATAAEDNIYEDNIINNITKGYNTLVRPSAQIEIDIRLALKQLSNLDEKNQILTSNSYFACFWGDSRLIWEPSDYGDTGDVLIPSSKIWLPDLFVINTASGSGYVPVPASSLAWVRSDGAVYVVFYLSSQTTRCSLNMKYYPFDSQTCSIVIGSWMMDFTKLRFTSDASKIDMSSYAEHAVWALDSVGVRSVNTSDRYFSLDKTIVNEDASFDFVLKRRPLYFMMNNIFPCLVLNIVVLLLFGVPFVPQVNACLTIFMTFSIYSLRVSSDMPTQSQYLPMVTLFYMLGISYTLLALTWFILVNEWQTKSSMPKWLNCLAVCVQRTLFCCVFDIAPFWKKGGATKTQVQAKSDAVKRLVSKCNNCDLCEQCLSNKQQEKTSKTKKQRHDTHLSAINCFVCFVLFVVMIVSNLVVWLFVSDPPSSY